MNRSILKHNIYFYPFDYYLVKNDCMFYKTIYTVGFENWKLLCYRNWAIRTSTSWGYKVLLMTSVLRCPVHLTMHMLDRSCMREDVARIFPKNWVAGPTDLRSFFPPISIWGVVINNTICKDIEGSCTIFNFKYKTLRPQKEKIYHFRYRITKIIQSSTF